MSDKRPEITHKCPGWGESFTQCCGRNPFELPRTDRMTDIAGLVTCRGRVAAAGGSLTTERTPQ